MTTLAQDLIAIMREGSGEIVVAPDAVAKVEALVRFGHVTMEPLPHGRFKLTLTPLGRSAAAELPRPRMSDKCRIPVVRSHA